MSSATALPGAPALQPAGRGWLLVGFVATEVLLLCVPGMWWLYVGLVLLAVFLLFGLLLSVLRGRATAVLLTWVLVFPLGYYYASFPKVEPLFTLDRLFFFLLLVTAGLEHRTGDLRIPADLRKSAVYWFVFVALAALTIPRVKLALSASRVLVEGFIFPAILAWFVLRYLNVSKHLRVLHLCVCLMATYVAGIGMAEVILQRDLMALPSSSVILAGQDTTAQFLVRPNGPFASTNSFALVGLVTFFFLGFLKKALGDTMPSWQRVMHRIAAMAALATAIMPLFRSVLTALLVILIVDTYQQRGARRWARIAVALSFLLLGLGLYKALPAVFEERSGSENIYGRIAEQEQVMLMFLDHPFTGVGFTNFYEAAQHSRYVTAYKGVESVDSQHNNLSAVLSDTGLFGFVPFVISQVLLVGCFWRLRYTCPSASAVVWRSFLFIFLAYWINGMSLTSGYYADLNIWYMFALAVLYKFALTEGSANRPEVAHA